MIKEIWINAKGLDGFYQVSNLGRVKSLSRIVKIGNNTRSIPERIIKPIKAKTGYYVINVTTPKRRQILLHRLVVDSFLGIPKGMVVNHKNLNKQDNSLSNIEVVTQFENIKHSCENGVNGRLVINTLNGVFYYTVVEAANAANMSVTALGKRLSGLIKNNTPYQYA
jgi:hypothetical protein